MMTATATADSAGISGGVSISVMLPSADVGGYTRAYVGDGGDITADSLSVKADSHGATASDPGMLATATSKVLGVSAFGSGGGVESEAIVSGVVEAFIGAHATADVVSTPSVNVGTGTVTVDADAYMKALTTADALHSRQYRLPSACSEPECPSKPENRTAHDTAKFPARNFLILYWVQL